MPQKLMPTSGAVAPISLPQAQPSHLINVPAGYTSPDVIDRRNGQTPTIGDRLRDLTIKVRDDYNDTYPSSPSPYGPQPLLPTSGKIGTR